MTNNITLHDCKLLRTEKGILIELPVRINLWDVPSVQNHSEDHDRYWNKHGHLYVRCDYMACFAPKKWDHDTLERKCRVKRENFADYSFSFRSAIGTDYRYEDFVFIDIGKHVSATLHGEGKEFAESMLATPRMGEYTKMFFSWLNAFGQEHGAKHLQPRNPDVIPLSKFATADSSIFWPGGAPRY
jgi:hypothetical protein